MTTLPGPAAPGHVDTTHVAVWGVLRWSSDLRWGQPDPRRDPLVVDRYTGQAYWGRHCWGADFWLRW